MTDHPFKVIEEALRGVGLWAASISEPSGAVEVGMTEALAALASLREERERWLTTTNDAAAAHYVARAKKAEAENQRLREALTEIAAGMRDPDDAEWKLVQIARRALDEGGT